MKNKVAVITGASRGIGQAIAQCLAKDGVLSVINYASNAEAAAATVADIEASGGAAFALKGDVSSLPSIQQFYEQLDTELIKRTGTNQFDILVNNECPEVVVLLLLGLLCSRLIPWLSAQILAYRPASDACALSLVGVSYKGDLWQVMGQRCNTFLF